MTLTDRRTGVVWPFGPAEVVTVQGTVVARPTDGVQQFDHELRYRAEGAGTFTLRLEANPPALVVAGEPVAGTKELRLLSHALPLTVGENGSYAAAYRMGVLFPADGRTAPFHRRWRDENSMAMFGAVKSGSALLVTWDDPFTEVQVDHDAQTRRLTMGLSMRAATRGAVYARLARGGYVEIAKAYRTVARERGLHRTLAEKARDNPRVKEMFGAADFKPFAFMQARPKHALEQEGQLGGPAQLHFPRVCRPRRALAAT